MFAALRDRTRRLLDRLPTVLPSTCALCGATADHAVCADCRRLYVSPAAVRCLRCGLPMADSSAGAPCHCGACLAHPPAFDATVVAADYAPPVDQLVLSLKFRGQLALAPLLASMLHDALQARSDDRPEQLTAVPLGEQRLAQRGFNQALEIARPLSNRLAVKLDAGLVARGRETEAQALLHPDQRRQNVRQAFLVPADAIDRVRGRHIGVVDDVMTTGETLNELAATLKRFGAARVTNIVFARTVR